MKRIVLPIIFAVIFILITVGLSGCTSTEEDNINEIDKFVGTWTQQGADLWHELTEVTTFVFSSDRTFTTNEGRNGTYQLSGGNFVLNYDDTGQDSSFKYQFSNQNTGLTLVDSGDKNAAYQRQ